MKRSVLIATTAALCGLGAGWTVRRLPDSGNAQHHTSSASEISGPTSAPLPPPQVFGLPSIDSVVYARGSELRRLIVRFLTAASIEDIEALLAAAIAQGDPRPEVFHYRWQMLTLRRAVELDAPAFHLWVNAFDGFPDADSREQLVSHFFIEWGQYDLEAALAASAGESERTRHIVLGQLGKADPDRALAMMHAEANGKSQRWQRAIETYESKRMADTASDDPRRALEAMLENDASTEELEYDKIGKILDRWSETDPAAAWDWLQGQPIIHYFAERAMTALVNANPDTAMAKLTELDDGAGKRNAAVTMAEAWAKKDIDAALSWALAQPAGIRGKLFNAIATPLAGSDPRRLFQIMIDEGFYGSDQTLNQMEFQYETGSFGSNGSTTGLRKSIEIAAKSIAAEDPRLALTYLGLIGEGDISAISGQWAAKDRSAVLDWAGTLPNGNFKRQVLQPAIATWASEFPGQAAAYLNDIGFTNDRTLAQSLANEWIKTDTDAAIEWARNAGNEALLGTLSAVASQSPPRSAKEAGLIEDTVTRRNAINNVANVWQRTDPGSTVQWIASLPEVDDLATMLRSPSTDWVSREPEAASQWIGSLPAGAARDNAVTGMVSALVSSSNPQKDFEAAAIWADTIQNSRLRQESQKYVRDTLAKRTGEGGAQ
ncbi:MAG: hypothetical protein R3F19_32730 [Verrucomicrobiales bacterium]